MIKQTGNDDFRDVAESRASGCIAEFNYYLAFDRKRTIRFCWIILTISAKRKSGFVVAFMASLKVELCAEIRHRRQVIVSHLGWSHSCASGTFRSGHRDKNLVDVSALITQSLSHFLNFLEQKHQAPTDQ